MAVAAEEIERLVREAIARSGGGNGAANVERIVGEVLDRLQAKTSSPLELILASRVVTLAEIEGRLEGIKQLVVPAKAVITPAVRDLLRQKKIDIGFALPGKAAAKVRLPLVVGVAETKHDAAGAMQAVAIAGVTIERLTRVGLAPVVGELCEAVSKGGKLGLLLTNETAAALCLANRRPGVRAVAATSIAATPRAVRSVGANLLTVDPAGRTMFEMQRIISQFVAGAPYACPAELAKELE
ncbi:MAG TPA: hypothetical protein VHC19_01765 [Pirellulales bacterium]|nr:hypothetical protein [Pirellulales bacterium]